MDLRAADSTSAQFFTFKIYFSNSKLQRKIEYYINELESMSILEDKNVIKYHGLIVLPRLLAVVTE